MWPFTRKYTFEESGFAASLTDYHSHVLPGVDDGIETIEESMQVLKAYEQMGIHTLWLTPHIMEDVPNKPQELRERFDELKARYTGPVRLMLAAENMLDNLFEQRVAGGDVLPIGDRGDHLLVETSYFTPPADLYGKLERTHKAGYFPLLAHPERYIYMDMADYERLHAQGVKMQLNLPSLTGFFGPEARKKAKELLSRGYYSAIGSDTHRYRQVEAMRERARFTSKTIEALRSIEGID